jgi:biotin transporter BioY
MFHMYLIVIAWLYVIVMFSAAQDNVVAGVLTFIFLGLLPLVLWVWMKVHRLRARREQDSSPQDKGKT